MNVKILSIRLKNRLENPPHYKEHVWVECSREAWLDATSDYHRWARSHAASLAGHGWDVLQIDDRIFIGHADWGKRQPVTGHFLTKDKTYRIEEATPEVLAELYDVTKRLFPTEVITCS